MKLQELWVIKSKSGGVVQLVMGAYTTREKAEASIPEYNKQYYGVDYLEIKG